MLDSQTGGSALSATGVSRVRIILLGHGFGHILYRIQLNRSVGDTHSLRN